MIHYPGLTGSCDISDDVTSLTHRRKNIIGLRSSIQNWSRAVYNLDVDICDVTLPLRPVISQLGSGTADWLTVDHVGRCLSLSLVR